MPLYLVDVDENEGVVSPHLPPSARGRVIATYAEDLSQAVVLSDQPIEGLTPLAAGADVGFDYGVLIVHPDEALPDDPAV